MKTEEILQGYSEAEQRRITQIAYQLGISADDPMFKMMATLGRYEETMIDLQARMEAMVEAWAALIDQKLADTTKAAQSMHYTVVSSAVRDEVKKIKPTGSGVEIQIGGWGLGSLSAMCGVVMAAGALLGSLTTWNVVSNIGASYSVVVSAQDLKILQWVKSDEGKQMYEILLKNQGAIEACQRENRLQGYCFIETGKTKK